MDLQLVCDGEWSMMSGGFTERTNGFTKAKNIVTSASKELSSEWKIPAKTIWIMELQK